LQARAARGVWLLRMEDIDPPREVPGAAADILRTLERLGLHWDGPVMYQSARRSAYEAALEKLRREGVLYACSCTRQEIADSSLHGIDGPVYPGTCRAGIPPGRRERALRVRTNDDVLSFADRWQGRVACRLQHEMGDFVVRRADGFIAYQLAVVVDDAAQGVTEVVRGADLLLSTPRQLYLQQCLGIISPQYAHLPVAVNAAGEKLSKQTRAESMASAPPLPLLRRVLLFLGQEAPPELTEGNIESFWRYAVEQWRPERVPRVRSLPA
jgi:glutamyl-Q tRNA(Asp) synthetase